RGQGFLPGQNVEEALGVAVVGAVVVGEGDFAWIIASNQCPPKDLRLRPHAGIEVSAHKKGCTGGGKCKRTTHKNQCNGQSRIRAVLRGTSAPREKRISHSEIDDAFRFD